MKNITLKTNCAGCGHADVNIHCKKPTLLTGVTTVARCGNCDSRLLYSINLIRYREKGTVDVRLINIRPTEKLVAIAPDLLIFPRTI